MRIEANQVLDHLGVRHLFLGARKSVVLEDGLDLLEAAAEVDNPLVRFHFLS